MWKLHVPIRLLLVGHHREHTNRLVIGSLDVAIGAGVVQTDRHLVDGAVVLEEKLYLVVRHRR